MMTIIAMQSNSENLL